MSFYARAAAIAPQTVKETALSGLHGLYDGAAIQTVSAIAQLAQTYHGYARNHSIGWALVWGLLVPWPIGIPIALAQGFGEPK